MIEAGPPDGGASPRTRLIGRDAELAAIEAWASAGTERLLTISGPGGCGKTRLAIEAGDPSRLAGADIVFVPLAELTDPATVDLAIAHVLGIIDIGGDDLLTAIAVHLGGRPTVLVLDNAEHLVDAVALVADRLLSLAAGLRVLVTSRRRLRLRGEAVLALRPLPVPAPDADDSTIGASPSVQLFCDRAALVTERFRLDPGTAESVAAICRRLDGLPLAIELAAARCAEIGPAALARTLDRENGARYLEGALRAMPDRHRGIAPMVASSYELLDDPTRRVFRALGALPGTWTLDIAEAVAPVPDASVIDAVSALVDLNLVEPDFGGTEPRYSMLETIRTEAQARLMSANELDDTLDRIADHCLAVVAGIAAETPEERSPDAVITDQLTLLRIGHARLCDTARTRDAQVVAVGTAPLLLSRGMAPEALRWLELSTPVARPDDPLGVDVEVWRCRLRAEIGPGETRPRRVEAWIAELDALRAASSDFADPIPWLRATDHLGHALTLAGRLDDAERITAEGLERCASAAHANWRTMLLHRATLLAQQRDDTEVAVARAQACGELAREIGWDLFVARAHQAYVQLTTDPATDPTDALAHNLELCTAVGDQRFATTALLSLGTVSLLQGRTAEGATHYLRAIALARSVGWWHSQGFAVMGAASAAALAERALDSARLHGALAASFDEVANGMPPNYLDAYHALQDVVRQSLGDVAYANAAEIGRTLSWRHTLEAAVASLEEIEAAGSPAAAASRQRVAERDEPTRLTDRELEVLRLLAQGLKNDEIAATLGISPKTVMHHSSHIYRKWGVRGRAAAVTYAFRNGYLDQPAR